jgi:sigma-B regulation protein RsbU (phosphoserine phosphatase)
MKIRIGHVERAFAVLLLVYMVASYFSAPGLTMLKLVVSLVGLWVAIRLARSVVTQMLWALRNRLIVAYFFIALVPIILITALVGLGGMLVGGQLSVYLVTSELERRTNALRSSVEFVARSPRNRPDAASNFAQFLQARFPGVQIMVKDGESSVSAPETGLRPPEKWPDGSGLLVRDHLLYGWAHVLREGRAVMALFPITSEFLGEMAPDVGESTVLVVRENRTLIHHSEPHPERPSHNRLPPPVNMLDREIWWLVPLPAATWGNPGTLYDDVWFTIRTRPSAILRTVMTQKVDFANELIPALFFTVAILFLIAEIIALLIGVSLTRTITGAVHDLYEGTTQIARGDFSHRIPLHGNDQLTALSSSFNNMAENMQRLLVVEKERERLQAELEIAREVQNQLYPRVTPELQSLRLTAVCDPARMVSGDYYDYQQLEGERVAIAIGDVAGKGISAALLMATVQSSFRTQLRGSIGVAAAAGRQAASASVSTSAIVSHLNQQLHADTTAEKYATFLLGVYDQGTNTMTYTNAGHLPPILVRDGRTERLEVNGMVVGAFPFAKYDESKIALLPGDLLVLFTDGVSEPENEYGEMFGEDRLRDLVAKSAHLEDDEIIRIVATAVHQWTGSDELQDDMTLLLVRRR